MRRLLRPAWPWVVLLAVGLLMFALEGVGRVGPARVAPTVGWMGLVLAAVGIAGLVLRRRLDPL